MPVHPPVNCYRKPTRKMARGAKGEPQRTCSLTPPSTGLLEQPQRNNTDVFTHLRIFIYDGVIRNPFNNFSEITTVGSRRLNHYRRRGGSVDQRSPRIGRRRSLAPPGAATSPPEREAAEASTCASGEEHVLQDAKGWDPVTDAVRR